MSRKLFLYLFVLIMSVSIGSSAKDLRDSILVQGVSLELAEQRKANISNVHYDITFSIPENKNDDIGGDISISFEYTRKYDLVIDFREEKENIKSVFVNGKEVKWIFEDEHIIIPRKSTKKGANTVNISFVAGNQSLNRNDDFLYTLFVPDRARTVFPCFEQPNIKAVFQLSLNIPKDWTAVSNGIVVKDTLSVEDGIRTLCFSDTEPLSTYLFAFSVGHFEHQSYTDNGRTIGAYYRETDSLRLAQLPDILKQVMSALCWQEEYTGIKYPFAKYDFVILPGFQFGGMEHTGATFYNDNVLFLSENPTPDERFAQASLIAHEMTHIWFGDLVTMKWFNDVWTKEVFANYFAAVITASQFPDQNLNLMMLRKNVAYALSDDRTLGGTAIRQNLDNLQNAGLIYNQIIYNKAPVMMRKLVELVGDSAFRDGLREYLRNYSYSNATWDDLIKILQSKTAKDVSGFSKVWVNEKGLPTMSFSISDGKLKVAQSDSYNRGLLWPQTFKVRLVKNGSIVDVDVEMSGTDSVFYSKSLDELFVGENITADSVYIIPNVDGHGYGMFVLTDENLRWLLDKMASGYGDVKMDDVARTSTMMLLYDNYLAHRIGEKEWADVILNAIDKEKDDLASSTLVNYLYTPMLLLQHADKSDVEQRLMSKVNTHSSASCKTNILRLLMRYATNTAVIDSLYSIWENNTCDLLNELDYMRLSYELALRRPSEAKNILSVQRSRISNPDRVRQFDYVSSAAVTDEEALDSLFESLLKPENRRVEPWAATVLSLLNHPLREKQSVKYIRPALEALADVQRTGDIFFPSNWTVSLLSNHISSEAYNEVRHFLDSNPDYPLLLRNKILTASYNLFRANEMK